MRHAKGGGRRKPFSYRQMGSTLISGAAAKVMSFAVLEKGMPWQFWKTKGNGSTPLSTNITNCSDPISADPICPFPSYSFSRPVTGRGAGSETGRRGGGGTALLLLLLISSLLA